MFREEMLKSVNRDKCLLDPSGSGGLGANQMDKVLAQHCSTVLP